MKKLLFLSIVMLCAYVPYAQNDLTVSIKNKEDKSPLPGATVAIELLHQSAVADSSGQAIIKNLPDGSYALMVSFVGFKEAKITLALPQTAVKEVLLEHDGEEHEDEEEVVVTSTRISRTIANTPTRTEVISGEELEEKGNMKPGDIRMMLNESTGIQTQQTSATSFNAGIRIQGLDGRYTQMLRDGYPLYSGFSGGLSLLQIAPLDLKQVEVIKGSASTLYGGGAIAGLVNLISKTPGEQRELHFLANGTSAGGLDLSGFYSQRYGKAGMTVFVSRNSNRAYDPADIGLSAIPKFERYTINPRLFLYGKRTTANMGVTYITEDRTGGSMDYMKNGNPGFFEKNNTDRITTQLGIAHKLSENATLQLKNSYSRFDRLIAIPDYSFDGLQQSSFSELTWNRSGEKADWVIGANVLTEDLKERKQADFPLRNYSYVTYGLFAQNAWTVSDLLVLETGLRGDYVTHHGFELLPRVSAMFKIAPAITTRVGGGYGYKTPTIFTEEAERMQFRNLLPADIHTTRNERSVGGNWDINYRTSIGAVGISLNHLFFYTKLRRPLVLVTGDDGTMELKNSSGYLDTKGMETNLRFTYGDFKLFVGYTYTDANTHYTGVKEWLPLTARHRLNNVLMYEVEDKWKLGLEAYYYSKQQLSDGATGKPYWITGFMAEKLWEDFSLFVNFENFTDTRQTRFGSIYTGAIDRPVFRDIYAPLDGFVVNGGVKLRL
ncbi:TonB-dependent receptor [Niabella beijingensis]|uniref:TonB-dependent receptor n=1 Tax=Niabella beijingensis TaxID=2872700 RepID=UPI001CC07223|nr:TonB-dependent receptor [Niabella beijingensis]MBZ4192441.1 TonB-dependent receptor [Niabella beijingensis]